MSDVNTSRDAVERLASLAGWQSWEIRSAATLRALVSERDAARAEAARLREALVSVSNLRGRQVWADVAADIARAALAEPTP